MKKAVMAALTAAMVLLMGVPAYADALAPGPIETFRNTYGDLLLVCGLVVLGLSAVTGIVLLIIFKVRKKHRKEEK